MKTYSRLTLAFLLLILVVPQVGADEPPTDGKHVERHENGQIKIRAIYRNGRLNGKFEERFKDGKYKIRANYRDGKLNGRYQEYALAGDSVRLFKVANYRNGQLHGEYREFNGDELKLHQFFNEGTLLIPKSVPQINAALSAIAQLPISIENRRDGYGYTKILNSVARPGQQAACKSAVRLLMQYRYLCGVPHEGLVIDYSMLIETTAAADISEIVGNISHAPINPGMPEAEFIIARKGCEKSNLAGVGDVVRSVHMYMEDSDEKNIDRVGHRCWCLNPKMSKTGFGAMGNFSAMYAVDNSRPVVPDFDFVAYPSRGFMPLAYFSREHAWSVQPNPNKYKFDERSVKVDAFPALFVKKRGTIRRDSQPLPLNYFNVSLKKLGAGPAIIFRPANIRIVKGSTYAVVIKGIETLSGEDFPLEYIVSFY